MKIKETIIKALSLGTGLAIGLLLIAKVCFEMSFDSFYRDIDRIHWIYTNYSQQGQDYKEYNQVSGAIAPGFRQYVPGVEAATRMTGFFEQDIWTDEDNREIKALSNFTDTCFFDVFDREIIAGDPKKALGEWGSVMVSRSFAEKMGGIDSIMGRQISNIQIPQLKLTVNGVFEDFPENGTLPYDILMSLETYSKQSSENWIGNDRYRGFVKLEKGIEPATLKDAIRLMQEKNQNITEIEARGMKFGYSLRPFSKIHTSDAKIRNMMFILSLTAFLLLSISVMNYILIAISAIVKRSKEVGVRKAYGAGRGNIYGVLFKETAVNMALSLAVAATVIYAAKPLVENLLGVELRSLFVPQAVIALAAVCIIIFLVSAIVPGYLYSKIPVSSALRNYKESRRNWKLVLLLVQFVINIFLVTILLVIAKQYDKAVNYDPGYSFENLVGCSLDSMTSTEINRFTDEVAKLADVTDIQRSYEFPLGGSSGDNIYLPGDDRELFNVADQYWGTDGFFDILEIPFIEGRNPLKHDEMAVSRSFVEKMNGFADWSDGAVGKKIRITGHVEHGIDEFTICGVYENYTIGVMNNADPRPSVKFWDDRNSDDSYMPLVMIKLTEVSRETIGKIQEIADSMYPERRIHVISYKEEFRNMLSEDRKMRNTIFIGCLFAVLIALFGLIGYIRDESQRRSKEMALRKINGATTGDIVFMLVIDIMKLAAVAIVIGNIAAWLTAEAWLKQFVERIVITPWYFIAADLIVLTIITICIILNSLRISGSNPVESLKNE